MSIPNPPTLTPAPSPAPTRFDPANFRERADAYHTWLVPHVNTQLPAMLAWIKGAADTTEASVDSAVASAAAALQSQLQASASASSASASASSATTSAAGASADRQAINQALLDTEGLPVYFGTHADALAASVTLPVGTPIVIGSDVRYGNRRTLNRVAYGGGDSLSLDFVNGIYQVDDMVEFIGYVTPQLVDVPATATSFGFAGAFAVDSSYLYVGTGTNTWKRIALGSF